jgi:hypothetical protein
VPLVPPAPPVAAVLALVTVLVVALVAGAPPDPVMPPEPAIVVETVAAAVVLVVPGPEVVARPECDPSGSAEQAVPMANPMHSANVGTLRSMRNTFLRGRANEQRRVAGLVRKCSLGPGAIESGPKK